MKLTLVPFSIFFASKLPSQTQRVSLTNRKQEMSTKEIASERNVSIKTIENQMGTALKMLRNLLKEHHYLAILLFLQKT